MLFWSSVFNQLCSLAPSGNSPLDIFSPADTHTHAHSQTHKRSPSQYYFLHTVIVAEHKTQKAFRSLHPAYPIRLMTFR